MASTNLYLLMYSRKYVPSFALPVIISEPWVRRRNESGKQYPKHFSTLGTLPLCCFNFSRIIDKFYLVANSYWPDTKEDSGTSEMTHFQLSSHCSTLLNQLLGDNQLYCSISHPVKELGPFSMMGMKCQISQTHSENKILVKVIMRNSSCFKEYLNT